MNKCLLIPCINIFMSILAETENNHIAYKASWENIRFFSHFSAIIFTLAGSRGHVIYMKSC